MRYSNTHTRSDNKVAGLVKREKKFKVNSKLFYSYAKQSPLT